MREAMKQPDVRPVKGPWWRPVSYVLAEKYKVTWYMKDGRHVNYEVHKGFRYDGSTEWVLLFLGLFPGFLLWIFGVSQDGLHRGASLVHDAVYRNGIVICSKTGRAIQITRKDADDVFYQVATYSGMSKWQAKIRWLFIRAFGWIWWLT